MVGDGTRELTAFVVNRKKCFGRGPGRGWGGGGSPPAHPCDPGAPSPSPGAREVRGQQPEGEDLGGGTFTTTAAVVTSGAAQSGAASHHGGRDRAPRPAVDRGPQRGLPSV